MFIAKQIDLTGKSKDFKSLYASEFYSDVYNYLLGLGYRFEANEQLSMHGIFKQKIKTATITVLIVEEN